ncbi:MAG: type II CAAX endopeptidase family protein [Candidatus Bathyarchaeia archaeon]
MTNVISYAFQIPLIILGLLLAWIICRAKSIQHTIKSKVKPYEAAIPLAIVVADVIFLWMIYSIGTNPFQNFPRPDDSFTIVISTLVFIVPPVVVVWALGNGFGSIRVSLVHIKSSAALGILVSIVLLAPTALFSPLFVLILQEGAIDVIHILSSIYVAFSEEVFYRGFVQTRLENFLGARTGLVVTAIIFNLGHAPTWILLSNMSPGAFVANVILLLPFAILLGYLSQKSNNILGSGIYHAAYLLPLALVNYSFHFM